MNLKLRSRHGLVALMLVSAFAIVLTGCSATVLPPTQHAPTVANAVKIYQKEPSKYEMLGDIEIAVTPEMTVNDRGQSVPGFEALIGKAASMGANGVLLQSNPNNPYVLVTVGYKGTNYQVPVRTQPTKTILAKAIFVVNE